MISLKCARTGGEVMVIPVMDMNVSVEELLKTAGIELKEGDVVTRDGEAIDPKTLLKDLKDGDILFIEQNDENGR